MRTFETDRTGANRGNGEKNLCSLCSLLFSSGRDGDTDFKFLARDTVPPHVDNRLPSIGSAKEGPMLVAGKPELREYKAVFVVADKEVSQYSDEITVNCAPLV
jgi:hypothetical protein